MPKTIYAFGESVALELDSLGRNPRGKKKVVGLPSPDGRPDILIAKLNAATSTTASGDLTTVSVRIQDFASGSSPATLSGTGNSNMTVWNPHIDIIPTGTYVVIGRTARGWVIITPLNWCP